MLLEGKGWQRGGVNCAGCPCGGSGKEHQPCGLPTWHRGTAVPVTPPQTGGPTAEVKMTLMCQYDF